MSNDGGQAARDYHEWTKHSLESLRRTQHVLDWANHPIPYKIYLDLPPMPLPSDLADSAGSALAAIAGESAVASAAPLDRQALARLLLHAAGVVRKVTYAGGRAMHFRAAACTGALYHIDLYLVCGPLADLEAGVYHFSPHDFALRPLRDGDHRATLIAATAAAPAVAVAPATLVLASTFWRNAWKYQARAYRHVFWDSGTILANLLAVASADGIATRLALGFVDTTVDHLVGLDGEREAAVALVALGTGAAPPPPAPPMTKLALATAPLSDHEIDYPEIRTVHTASALADAADVAGWRGLMGPTHAALDAALDVVPFAPPVTPATDSITAVIRRRGSTRTFAHLAIEAGQLAEILRRATTPIAADVSGIAIDPYVIVNAVDDVEPGAYAFSADRSALIRLRAGDLRHDAGYLDLGQELAADASVNVYLLADLAPVLARFGSRGYRAAQMLASIVGGRMYLAAYALGLGATGLTFLDDDVTAFFSPHARGKSVLFLIAIGRPQRRRPSS